MAIRCVTYRAFRFQDTGDVQYGGAYFFKIFFLEARHNGQCYVWVDTDAELGIDQPSYDSSALAEDRCKELSDILHIPFLNYVHLTTKRVTLAQLKLIKDPSDEVKVLAMKLALDPPEQADYQTYQNIAGDRISFASRYGMSKQTLEKRLKEMLKIK